MAPAQCQLRLRALTTQCRRCVSDCDADLPFAVFEAMLTTRHRQYHTHTQYNNASPKKPTIMNLSLGAPASSGSAILQAVSAASTAGRVHKKREPPPKHTVRTHTNAMCLVTQASPSWLLRATMQATRAAWCLPARGMLSPWALPARATTLARPSPTMAPAWTSWHQVRPLLVVP